MLVGLAGPMVMTVACADPEPPGLVRKTIGPEGGLISSQDNVLTVVLQPGALDREVDVEVFPSSEPPAVFGPAYRVRPDIELSVAAEITYRRVLPSNPNSATVAAIRLGDYADQMGYWRPLPRLALNLEQQSVIASDGALSLYYGLIEDGDAPAPPSGTGDGDEDPPGGSTSTGTSTTDPPGTTSTSTTTGPGGSSGEGTTSRVTIDPSSGDDNGSTSVGPGSSSDDDGMGMSSDDGRVMVLCGDGMPAAGELCLVPGGAYASGMDPADVGIGEYTGDASLDVVTLDLMTLEVGLVPGVGDGTLAAPAGGTAVGPGPVEIRAGDFSGDGQDDVVVLNTGSNGLGLLIGDGAGGLGAQIVTMAGAGLVDLSEGDFDGNAAQDIGVLNATDTSVQMMLGGGAGFVAGPATVVGAGSVDLIAVGDYNPGSDDFDDLMSLGPAGFDAWATDGAGAGYIGEITGVFGGGGTFVELVAGDIDGDGNDDVAAIDIAGDTLVVGLSTGAPANYNFQAPLAVGVDPSDVVLADLDGDGDLEAVVSNAGSDEVMVLAWDAGAYMLAFTFATGTAPSGVAVGDLDGDTVLDVVVSNEGSDTISVFLSDP